MEPFYFVLCQGLVVLLVGVLVVLVYQGVRTGLGRLKLGAHHGRRIAGWVILALGCWLAVLALLSGNGFFEDFTQLPPPPFWAALPPLVLIGLLLRSRLFRLLLRVMPYRWLIGVQSFRLVMELVLWLGFVGGFVPWQLTFKGFNQDIIVGLTAPLAAALFFRQRQLLKFEAILWNLFGLLLLVNAVVIAVLSTPSELRVFLNEPSTAFVARWPFIWIPGFIVPFAIAMHVFSLAQLLPAPDRRRVFRFPRGGKTS